MQMAIIGVFGTLLGTLMGWFLNYFSQKGKLLFFVKNWKIVYEKRLGPLGEFSECKKDEAEQCYYELILDVYNSSCETRIMREVNISFLASKGLFFDDIPKDEETKDSINQCVEVEVFNIPAKSVRAIKLRNGFDVDDDEWNTLIKASVVTLKYRDERNNERSIRIYKEKKSKSNKHKI